MSWQAIKPMRRYGDFSIFEDGGRRHVGFYEILTVGTLKRVKLCHHAKCRGKRSNQCGDIIIFRFFKMAAAAILDL